jgi:hypothetical protein
MSGCIPLAGTEHGMSNLAPRQTRVACCRDAYEFVALNNLAELYCSQGCCADAEPLEQRRHHTVV